MGQQYVPKEIEFRENLDSRLHNKERRDIFSDVSRLYDSSAAIDAELSTLTDLKEASDFTLLSKIQGLETILTDLNFGFTILTMYNSDTVLYPESININTRASHEQLYGRVILNSVETQRLYISKDIRTGKDVVSKDIDSLVFVDTNAERTGSKINRIIETEVAPIFDTSSNDVFLRRYETFENIQDVDLIMELNTKNGLDTEYNNIYISPLPESTSTLDFIRYSGAIASNESFFNTSTGQLIDFSIPNLRRVAFAFNPVKLNQVEFRLKQANKLGEAPFKYLLGLRDVAIVNHIYTNLSYIGFKVPVDASRTNIIGLTSNLESFQQNCELFVYKNLADFNGVTTNYIFKTGDSIDAVNSLDVSDVSDIYILAKLTPFAGVNDSPELTNIFIEWR